MCIRDRYQRRVHGDINIKLKNMRRGFRGGQKFGGGGGRGSGRGRGRGRQQGRGRFEDRGRPERNFPRQERGPNAIRKTGGRGGRRFGRGGRRPNEENVDKQLENYWLRSGNKEKAMEKREQDIDKQLEEYFKKPKESQQQTGAEGNKGPTPQTTQKKTENVVSETPL
eukprot:TRINITY_DN2423_c0_g1_i5.p1 TRINITY_DN2423_c0_g1~~TRINITY_DN2423_c0_g1_i5.p1  ORF type:complete len:168 (+),score=59.06 TRINITY_DN2423_c0_g1_i5:72-575(+)